MCFLLGTPCIKLTFVTRAPISVTYITYTTARAPVELREPAWSSSQAQTPSPLITKGHFRHSHQYPTYTSSAKLVLPDPQPQPYPTSKTPDVPAFKSTLVNLRGAPRSSETEDHVSTKDADLREPPRAAEDPFHSPRDEEDLSAHRARVHQHVRTIPNPEPRSPALTRCETQLIVTVAPGSIIYTLHIITK